MKEPHFGEKKTSLMFITSTEYHRLTNIKSTKENILYKSATRQPHKIFEKSVK